MKESINGVANSTRGNGKTGKHPRSKDEHSIVNNPTIIKEINN